MRVGPLRIRTTRGWKLTTRRAWLSGLLLCSLWSSPLRAQICPDGTTIPANPTSRVNVTFAAGETCLVANPLVVNTQYISIIGNGATLDCSHLASGTTCLTFQGSGNTYPGFYNQNPVSESSLEIKGPGSGVSGATGVLAATIDTQIIGFNVHDFSTCYSLDGPNSFKELFVQDEGWNCGTGITTGTDAPANSGELIRWGAGGIFNSTNGVVMQNTGGGYELAFEGTHFDGLTGPAFTLATAPNSTAEVELSDSHIEYTSPSPGIDMIVLGGDNNYTWFRSINSDFQVDGTGSEGVIHSVINAVGTGWANIISPWFPIYSYVIGRVTGSGIANVTITGGMMTSPTPTPTPR